MRMQDSVNVVARVIRFGLAALCLFSMQTTLAQPVVYEKGVHYQELATPLPDLDPDRIEVVELFWYGCPACYDFLPVSQIWESSYRTTDMDFARLPVVWNNIMATHAKAFLTADALGLLPTVNKGGWEVTRSIHNELFDAIQLQEQALSSADELWPLFQARGASREAFDTAWNSSEVAARLDELRAMSASPELASVPALVLHGRYVLSYNAQVQDDEALFKVLNFLVARIRDEQRAQRR